MDEVLVNGVDTQEAIHDLIFFAKEFYDVIGDDGAKLKAIVEKIKVLDGAAAEKVAQSFAGVRSALGEAYNGLVAAHKQAMYNR